VASASFAHDRSLDGCAVDGFAAGAETDCVAIAGVNFLVETPTDTPVLLLKRRLRLEAPGTRTCPLSPAAPNNHHRTSIRGGQSACQLFGAAPFLGRRIGARRAGLFRRREFFCAYLLVVNLQAKGDVRELLLGTDRASS
jgi:hypothetical protein